MTDPETRAQLQQLQQRLQEAEEWADGLYLVLNTVLPPLLRGHPQAGMVRDLLAHMDRRYEELLAHPERAESADERAGNYEAAKMLHRGLDLMQVWPQQAGTGPAAAPPETT